MLQSWFYKQPLLSQRASSKFVVFPGTKMSICWWYFQEYLRTDGNSTWLVGYVKNKSILFPLSSSHSSTELKLYLSFSINLMGENCHCDLISYNEKHFLCVIDTKIYVMGF